MKSILTVLMLYTTSLYAGIFDVHGDGHYAEKKRSFTHIRSLEVSGPFRIELLSGTRGFKISGDRNIVNLIEPVQKDGHLLIKPLRSVDPSLDLVLQLSAPTLEEIHLAGKISGLVSEISDISRIHLSGDVDVDFRRLITQDLTIEQSGKVSSRFTGEVLGDLHVKLLGAASLDASHMKIHHISLEAIGRSKLILGKFHHADGQLIGTSTLVCPKAQRLSVRTIGASRIVEQ